MEEAFKQIQLIESVAAAGWLLPEAESGEELLAWCANTPVEREAISHIGLTLESVMDRMRGRDYASHTISVAFADRTVVARRYESGLFFVWLDSPVNDAVLDWLWPQVEAALATTGVDLTLA